MAKICSIGSENNHAQDVKKETSLLSLEEFSMLKDRIEGAENLDDLKEAFSLVNAARSRMTEEDCNLLTSLKDEIKNRLINNTEQ